MNVYQEIVDFYKNYAGEKRVIGTSCEGRQLFAFFVGKHEGPIGISQYAIHAREWVTAYLALEHIGRGVPRGGVWFVPLVNPDGALLSEIGAETASFERREFLNRFGSDFSLWKANAEGVDLNVNFPARWGTGRGNVRFPAPQGYIGQIPLCAPESRALAEFTLEIKPQFTLSWHTKGEEIYWRFHQKRLLRDKRLANILRKSTGYPLKNAPHSAGGYKDWCIEKLSVPAFTIEVGSDKFTHPLGKNTVWGIFSRCGAAIEDFTKGF